MKKIIVGALFFIYNQLFLFNFSVLLRGATGLLRPQDSFVVATLSASGFTLLQLPAGRNTIVLVPFQIGFVTLSNFQLRVDEICADGSALTVQVEYYTRTTVVSKETNYLVLR